MIEFYNEKAFHTALQTRTVTSSVTIARNGNNRTGTQLKNP